MSIENLSGPDTSSANKSNGGGEALLSQAGKHVEQLSGQNDERHIVIADDVLRRSEERYQLILENIHDGYFEVALSGRLTYINDGLVRIFGGRSKAELLNADIAEFTDKKNAKRLRKVAEKVLRTGESIPSFIYKTRRRNGDWYDADISLALMVDDKGMPVGFRGIIRDVTERRRAETILRESEARFRTLAETASDAILTIDESGNIIFANSAIAKVFGYAPEAVIGQNLTMLMSEANRFQHQFGLARYRKTGQRQMPWTAINWKGLHRDGSEIPLELSIGEFVSDGRRYFTGIARDITERKLAEDAVRDSEERFATAFNASPVPMAILELPTRRYVNINESLTQSSGWTEADIIGRTPLDLNIWSDEEDYERTVELIKINGFVRNLEAGFRTKSGEVRQMLYSAERIVFKSNPHLLIVANDITDRKRVEEALRRSEEWYRLLFEHGFAGIFRSTESGQILECNEALAIILGYDSREELLQSPTANLYFDEMEQLKMSERLKPEGSVRNYERLMRNKDGSQIWTLTNATLIPSKDGGELVLEGVVLDITERKWIEDQLAQSSEQMRALSSRLETVREEERTHIAREIHDNLGQLMTGLKLDFSWLEKRLARVKEESLRKEMEPKLGEIAKLLEETIQTVRNIATDLRPGVLDTLGLRAAIDWQAREFKRRNGVNCSIKLCQDPTHLPPERATALFRVLQEILTNITRHAKAKMVRVEMTKTDGEIRLTVTDNGIGITEEQVLSPKSLGLLGMSERVVIFGGSLTVRGERGRGTTVKVRMPIKTIKPASAD